MAKKRTAPKPRTARVIAGAVRKKAQAGAESEIVRPGLAFPVVAIGASAGGLEAFTALLKALPPHTGMAFVLIQHLEPKHESALAGLLSKARGMAVVEVSDGLAAEPDHVYVIPPNKNMTIREGMLRLAPRSELHGLNRPIDDFSVALAEEQGRAAIGVVLSGTGSDGTYGLKAIKAAGGVTFAQDPKTAQWPAMPMSAITAGSVDFVLSPKRIAAELARIGRHPYLVDARDVPEGSELDKICVQVRSAVGVDFRLYKQATVRRRIARRMALRKIGSLQKYTQVLKQDPAEAQTLADDIFIHVTSFFRDPQCFQALRKKVLAKLGPKRLPDDPIRIWVPGCSTGQEVYSVAMLLLEELGERVHQLQVQIFGTDIQERAVEQARAGIYTQAAVDGVSSVRLKRFFVKTESGYQIQKFVRDLCVFARHDLAKDPPLSRMDLISCRNALIYFAPQLQRRVLSILQYALKPGGSLFLGASESIGDADAFTVEDREHRIFARKPAVAPFRELNMSRRPAEPETVLPRISAPGAALDFRQEAEGALLAHYAPPALIIDADLHIRHVQGDTSPYMALATGPPSFHLLKMVRPEFMVDLRTAIGEARRRGVAVHRDHVESDDQGQPSAVRLEVRPVGNRNRKQDLLVVFQKLETIPAESSRQERKSGTGHGGKQRRAEWTTKLERDLEATREQLHIVIAEQESAQEAMTVANKEILSSNEELQSANEELETAKEELYSSNEELITLNHELQQHDSELAVLSHDLNNLLVGIDIPVLVLDADLRVRRFTPVAGALLNLIPADVGRPFSNIASNLDVSNWQELFSQVLGEGRLIEREVSDREGHRYSLRMRPYKTSEDRIEGVLLVMLDTDAIYRARDEAQRLGDHARAIVEAIHEALVVVDSEGRVISANHSFCDLFRVSFANIEHESLFSLSGVEWDARLRGLLDDILQKGAPIEGFELDQHFPETGRRHLLLNARQIHTMQTILIAIEDVTERKRAQEASDGNLFTARALLEASTQSIVGVDLQAKIVVVNGSTENMFGYSREELLGKPLEVLIPESSRQRHREHQTDYFSHMQSRPMGIGLTLEGRRMDGTTFPVEIGLKVIDTEAGKLTVAFVSDITQRRKVEQVAQARAQEVQALASSLLTVQEEERRRVSRELHDQICQQLASLAIDIGGMVADSPPAGDVRQRLKALQVRAVRASEETRHIAYQLHPSILEDLGLVASLEALCKEFSEQHPDLALEFTDGVLPMPVPREVASCLYRVTQASLQNTAEHASAQHVSVKLTVQKETLALAIVDDGIGFDPKSAKERGGLGLIGMEERVRLVKGKLTIDARPGHGTRIAVEVPCPASGA